MRKEVDIVNQKPGQSGEQVLEVMHAIVHLYRSRQLRGLRSGAHDLAHMEVRALGYFARNPGATQSDLVAHSGRDKAQVARLIRSLRDGGLLDAASDVHDRRSTRLTLSAAGHDVFMDLHARDSELGELALAGVTIQECSSLMAVLSRIQANLERA